MANVNTCGHNGLTMFPIQNPTDEDIKKYKMWKCKDCGRWQAFLPFK